MSPSPRPGVEATSAGGTHPTAMLSCSSKINTMGYFPVGTAPGIFNIDATLNLVYPKCLLAPCHGQCYGLIEVHRSPRLHYHCLDQAFVLSVQEWVLASLLKEHVIAPFNIKQIF